MSAPTEATDLSRTPLRSGLKYYRLTVDQFLKMIDAGVFPAGARIELLGGMLVDKMTKNEPHNFATESLAIALRGMLPDGWCAREEKSVVLGRRWRPEPDVAVVLGPRGRYRTRAPGVGEIAMLVEVADSSYAADREEKWRRYAACGVPIYWIVNLPGRSVEVHGEPSGEGKAAHYRVGKAYGLEEEAPVVLDGHEVGRVLVRDIIP